MKLYTAIFLILILMSCTSKTPEDASVKEEDIVSKGGKQMAESSEMNLPDRIEGPTRLQDFYAALQHQDYAFMWNMIAPDARHSRRRNRIAQDAALEFPGEAVGGLFTGRDVILDRFIGMQFLVKGSLKFVYRWVGTSSDSGDREILEFFTTADVPVNGVNQPYENRGAVIVTFNKDNRIIEIHDYLDTEELQLVGLSDNIPNLEDEVRASRTRAGLPGSVYPPQVGDQAG